MEYIRIRYYSATGNTKMVAEYIAEEFGIIANSINSDVNEEKYKYFLFVIISSSKKKYG